MPVVHDPVELLRNAGLKASAPRVALLAALLADRSHPSAEELHEALRRDHPTLSLSTVYLGLEAFLRAGLCRRVRTPDGRLRVDGIPDAHDHAICVTCGAVFDIDCSYLPRPAERPVLPGGHRVSGVRVEYDVVCAACAAPATD